MLQGSALDPEAEKKTKHFNSMKNESEAEEKETEREGEVVCVCVYVVFLYRKGHLSSSMFSKMTLVNRN